MASTTLDRPGDIHVGNGRAHAESARLPTSRDELYALLPDAVRYPRTAVLTTDIRDSALKELQAYFFGEVRRVVQGILAAQAIVGPAADAVATEIAHTALSRLQVHKVVTPKFAQAAGAFDLLRAVNAWKADPEAVHGFVVDPGVGSSRGAVVVHVELDDGINVQISGPNNAVLSLVAEGRTAIARSLDPSLRVESAERVTTFDGARLFGPALARAALGLSIETDEEATLIGNEWPEGTVLHRDNFDNLKILGYSDQLEPQRRALHEAKLAAEGPVPLHALPKVRYKIERSTGETLDGKTIEHEPDEADWVFEASFVDSFSQVPEGHLVVLDGSTPDQHGRGTTFVEVTANLRPYAAALGLKPGDKITLLSPEEAARVHPGDIIRTVEDLQTKDTWQRTIRRKAGQWKQRIFSRFSNAA